MPAMSATTRANDRAPTHSMNTTMLVLTWLFSRIIVISWATSTDIMRGDVAYYERGFSTPWGRAVFSEDHPAALQEYPYPIAGAMNLLSKLSTWMNVSFTDVFTGTCLMLDLMCLILIHRTSSSKNAWWWVIGIPALGALSYSRLDLFVAVGLCIGLCLITRNVVTSQAGFSLATSVKLWPALLSMTSSFAPHRAGETRVHHLWRIWHWAIVFNASWIIITTILAGPTRLVSPLIWQSGRGFQMESSTGSIIGAYYGLFHPHKNDPSTYTLEMHHGSWEYVGSVLNTLKPGLNIMTYLGYTAILALLFKTRTWRSWNDNARSNFALVGLSITLIFTVTSTVLSPQYLIWIVPFLVFITNDNQPWWTSLRLWGLSALLITNWYMQRHFYDLFLHDIHYTYAMLTILMRNIILWIMLGLCLIKITHRLKNNNSSPSNTITSHKESEIAHDCQVS